MTDTHPHSTVVALVYDGLCTFEFGCAYEVFGLPRPELDRNWCRFEVCAVEPGLLRAAGGITIQAPSNLHLIEKADTVIVPGWKNPDAPASPLLLAALRRVVERGGLLASICSGAFLLAAAGGRPTRHHPLALRRGVGPPLSTNCCRPRRALRRRRTGSDLGRQCGRARPLSPHGALRSRRGSWRKPPH